MHTTLFISIRPFVTVSAPAAEAERCVCVCVFGEFECVFECGLKLTVRTNEDFLCALAEAGFDGLNCCTG